MGEFGHTETLCIVLWWNGKSWGFLNSLFWGYLNTWECCVGNFITPFLSRQILVNCYHPCLLTLGVLLMMFKGWQVFSKEWNFSWTPWFYNLTFFKELHPLLIPSNEYSVSFFKKETVKILKSLSLLTLLPSSCFTFIAVMKATLGRDARELTCFT